MVNFTSTDIIVSHSLLHRTYYRQKITQWSEIARMHYQRKILNLSDFCAIESTRIKKLFRNYSSSSWELGNSILNILASIFSFWQNKMKVKKFNESEKIHLLMNHIVVLTLQFLRLLFMGIFDLLDIYCLSYVLRYHYYPIIFACFKEVNH